MNGRFVRWGVTVFAVLAVFGAASPASAGGPIGPNEHFIGLVNSSHHSPVVTVNCPGPIRQGRTGHVTGDQTVSVQRVRSGGGYTGPFQQVVVWFVPRRGGPAPIEMHVTRYGATQQVPTSITVPCGGKGQVEFSSCPYLAPCAAGWVPYYVSVRFENIGV